MNHIGRSLTTIYRTERLIAQRRFAVVQNQIILFVLSGVVALIGLILLNVSLFFVLEARMSPAAASGILTAANVLLAGLIAFRAGRMHVQNEIAPALEVRNIAIADLEGEIEEATQELRVIANSLKGIRMDPLGSLPALILPLLTAILKKKT